MFPKEKRWRSDKYIKWIKDQPCYICGRDGVDPHHIIGVGHLGGTATKAPDWATIPLCRQCHTNMHHDTTMWPSQFEMVFSVLGRAITKGVLK